MQLPGHKGTGAVDGIDNPGQAVAGLVAKLLAVDAVVGKALGELVANDRLSGPIRLGDRVEPAIGALVLHRGTGPEKRQRRVPGHERQIRSGRCVLRALF